MDTNMNFIKKKFMDCSANISDKAEDEARNFYLELMKDIARQLSSLLLHKKRNLWWFLNISEKNIWTDQTVHRLYALARLGPTGLKRSSNKSILLFVFSYYIQALKEVLKLGVKLLCLRTMGLNRKREIPEWKAAFFGLYPAWWRNPISKNTTDIFFQEIPLIMGKKVTTGHLVWLEPWRQILKKRKRLLSFLNRKDVVVLEQELRLSDILSVFDPVIIGKLVKALKLSASVLVSFKGVNISPFVQEEIFNSGTSPLFFQALLLDPAMRRTQLQHLGSLFFRLEFQPLERALLYNTFGKTKSIGFQHSVLSKNFFNYRFMVGELGEYWNRRKDPMIMPLPDFILLSGELGYRFMKEAGYPEENLYICGGIRFTPLFKYLEHRPSLQVLREKYSLPADKKVILIATSPLPRETSRMLEDLFDAIGSDDQFRIIIKVHPNAVAIPGFLKKVRKIIESKRWAGGAEIITSRGVLYDYISLSNAILLTGGTVALEAMLLGVVPIIYKCSSQFSHNPMLGYPESVFLVSDSQSLKKALKEICMRSMRMISIFAGIVLLACLRPGAAGQPGEQQKEATMAIKLQWLGHASFK
ncbi:MAG: hypothetical protein NC916_02080, partial [Candidatus Omnitrophica bacterium]|nr:hypothetical protein [Candidatus Omnitrophota bacterium]